MMPDWKLPWTGIPDTTALPGMQQELEKEVGPGHPLWGKQPQVIGRRINRDDILVRLSDGTLAVVHLVWHGKIDPHPGKYPLTTFYANAGEFHARMEEDALDYGE